MRVRPEPKLPYGFRSLLLAAVSALSLLEVSAADTKGGPPLAEIYARAEKSFAVADLYKPAERSTNELTYTLAPLILQEVKAEGKLAQSGLSGFGALSVSNSLPISSQSRPTVFVTMDTVQVNGRTHARVSYFWSRGVQNQGEKGSSALQGVRITLNANGQPAIWEVLADSTGVELVFVSESLEAAAKAEFGEALPGRRHACERGVSEAPKFVVARVIDDGPVPMGPMVYLSDPGGDVSTVTCRCMPVQAKELRTTSTYDLVSPGLSDSPLARVGAQGNATATPWPGDDGRLSVPLRLPGSF